MRFSCGTFTAHEALERTIADFIADLLYTQDRYKFMRGHIALAWDQVRVWTGL